MYHGHGISRGHGTNHGHGTSMPSPIHNPSGNRREKEFESLVAELFRRAGWRVQQEPSGEPRADLVAEGEGKRYVIEIKRSAEGRRDRLIPLVSQAILQAQAAARAFSNSAIPVAVVGSYYISEPVADQVKRFALSHAPNVGVGVMDAQGFRAFHGFGLERFNSGRSSPPEFALQAHGESPSNLFSDLNQWMLKVLIGGKIPESLLSVPRGEYRSGRQLAEAAGVSPMSASRLVRQLVNEGFLDEVRGALRLVRLEELLQQWRAASQRSVREVPARWIIRGGNDQLRSAVRSYRSWLEGERSRRRRPNGRVVGAVPRICVGLFAASDWLGFGFVQGAAPHIYLEQLNAAALDRLGLSVEERKGQPELHIRVPENPEAIFRAVVERNGVPVSDVLQVWLDVSNHPSRGKEQADQIWKRVLAPALMEH